MGQLKAGRFIGKDHILSRNPAANKLHGLIHVLLALVLERKGIAILLRSKSLAKNDDSQGHGCREGKPFFRDPRDTDGNSRQRKNGEEHALPHSAIGIHSCGRSDPVEYERKHEQNGQRSTSVAVYGSANQEQDNSRREQQRGQLPDLRLSENEAKYSERSAI